ncbi:MAG: hypothetical protein HHJ12_17175 [Glaciimonas sp.]|nr:hypothetical protein [Glaciimonas sp.]
MQSIITKFLIVAALSLPFATWAFFKPVRVLAPELAGVTCINKHICVEKMRQAKEAIRLYTDAMSFVRSNGGDIHANPRALFCSTLKYSQSF